MTKNSKKSFINVADKNRHVYYFLKKSRNVYRAQLANIVRYFAKKTDLISTKKYDLLIEPVLNSINRGKDVKTAVVIHLFYTESWELFVNRLKCLDDNFDIFITMPKQNTDFIETIKNTFPDAYIFIVPNRGRDVLSFIKVLPTIYSAGYQNILKIHTKKSTHRKDGDRWLSDMVDKLLPRNKNITNRILAKLDDTRTGIIGPQNHYISLLVNFRQNWHHSGDIISRIYTKKISKQIRKEKNNYGFFAGTMFWARIDSLVPIIDENFNVNNFEKEKGQIDCTFAHALERVFCLVPEIENKILYEISKTDVKEISYKTNNIPDWSRVRVK